MTPAITATQELATGQRWRQSTRGNAEVTRYLHVLRLGQASDDHIAVDTELSEILAIVPAIRAGKVSSGCIRQLRHSVSTENREQGGTSNTLVL